MNTTHETIELTHDTIMPTVVGMIKERFTPDILQSLLCKNGDTQKCEEKYKVIIREVLNFLQITFTEAHSQEPYDFRLMFEGIIYWTEIKKIDSTASKFNDTYPKENSHYIFLYTAKSKSHTPGVIYVKGSDFPDREWYERIKERNDFHRISSKSPSGGMSSYSRINLSLDAPFLVPLLEQEGCIPVKKSPVISKVRCFCGLSFDPIKGKKKHNKTKTHLKALVEKSNNELQNNIIHPFISNIGDKLLQDTEFTKNWSGDKSTLYNAIKKALE